MNKFKTAKKFEKRGLLPLVFTPSRPLANLLRKYILVRNKQDFDHKFLISNLKGKPFTKSFTNWFTSMTFKYVGKKLGTSMLRKIYITEFLKSNPSLKQKQVFMQKCMQLSLETHESYGRFYLPDDLGTIKS